LCLKPCFSWLLFWPPKFRDDYSQESLFSIYGHNFRMLSTAHGSSIPVVLLRNNPTEDINVRPTVLFSHGNAEDLNNALKFCKMIQENCHVNVLVYDYSGYGISEGGIASERNLEGDIMSVYTFLTDELRVLPRNVVLWGRSLGSAPTLYLASLIPVHGILLHSPLLSVLRTQINCCCCCCILSCLACPNFCCQPDAFVNIHRIDKINCPVFIIHGTKDAVVPFWHGQYFSTHLKNSVKPLWVEDAGHNDILKLAKRKYMSRARQFIAQLYRFKIEAKSYDNIPAKGMRREGSMASPVSTVAAKPPDDYPPRTSGEGIMISGGGEGLGGGGGGGGGTLGMHHPDPIGTPGLTTTSSYSYTYLQQPVGGGNLYDISSDYPRSESVVYDDTYPETTWSTTREHKHPKIRGGGGGGRVASGSVASGGGGEKLPTSPLNPLKSISIPTNTNINSNNSINSNYESGTNSGVSNVNVNVRKEKEKEKEKEEGMTMPLLVNPQHNYRSLESI